MCFEGLISLTLVLLLREREREKREEKEVGVSFLSWIEVFSLGTPSLVWFCFAHE